MKISTLVDTQWNILEEEKVSDITFQQLDAGLIKCHLQDLESSAFFSWSNNPPGSL